MKDLSLQPRPCNFSHQENSPFPVRERDEQSVTFVKISEHLGLRIKVIAMQKNIS